MFLNLGNLPEANGRQLAQDPFVKATRCEHRTRVRQHYVQINGRRIEAFSQILDGLLCDVLSPTAVRVELPPRG